jgi:hypothetical protein
MDPITAAIVAALAGLAEPAVKDAYEGLKSLIVKKLGGDHEAVAAVGDLEKKPDSAGRRATLGEELAASPITADAEVLAAAGRLLEVAHKHSATSASVQQTVTGSRNIFSGTGDIHIGGNPP